MCLQSHYRKVLVFCYDALDNANVAYQKLKNKANTLKQEGEISLDLCTNYLEKFKTAIGDDLNTSLAITTLYDVLKSDLNDCSKRYLIEQMDQVLSLNLLENTKKNISKDLEQYIKEKIEERNIAKQNKDFALADSIRNELKEKGIIIKDTREGTTYEVL